MTQDVVIQVIGNTLTIFGCGLLVSVLVFYGWHRDF